MTEDDFAVERRRMVTDHIAARGVKDARILEVMGSVLRHLFIPAGDLAWAYADGPLPIGQGQTISQPYIVALMTECLQLTGTECVLEVGTGSGYQAAVLAHLAAEVHTVEVIPELAVRAAQTLANLGYSNVFVHSSDGTLGWPAAAPYAGILVAAAGPAAPPPLLDQLGEGGRMVVPVGSRGSQHLEIWNRSGGKLEVEASLQVAFVPLRGEYGWK
jgi:protein-L-isoaspartate(D-aspartate) O-methyltransferase